MIRALSLFQPWASLVATGAKRMEARSWPTPYRGPLALAASKRFPADARELCIEWPFDEALAAAGFSSWREMPCGAVLATCRLIDCVPTRDLVKRHWTDYPLTARERAFGDFSPGRYAYLLADVVPLPEPVPVSGSLGFWHWDEVAAGVALPDSRQEVQS